MLDDGRAAVLLGTIVNVAHALGHVVVAEGVEEVAQLQVLQGIECDIVQGFFFSRPVPAKALPEIVRDGFPGVAAKGQENHDVVAAETPTSGAGSRTPSS